MENLILESRDSFDSSLKGLKYPCIKLDFLTLLLGFGIRDYKFGEI